MGKLRLVVEHFKSFEPKTKWMVAGTIALVAVSIFLSTSNLIERVVVGGEESENVKQTTEEEGLIPSDADPIPFQDERTGMVVSLMNVLGNEDAAWIATDDPICAVGFTERGFDEYTGDIKASYALEFYDIERAADGWTGTWRVLAEDGSTSDARFAFTQDRAKGVCRIESAGFPHHAVYQTKAFTSEDVTQW